MSDRGLDRDAKIAIGFVLIGMLTCAVGVIWLIACLWQYLRWAP